MNPMAVSATSSQIQMFSPPGGLKDFNESQREAWSRWISGQIDQAIIGYPNDYLFDGPRSQFYNPVKTPAASDARVAKISWIGFPKQVKISQPTDQKRWELADFSRDSQDEYCEWSVSRDKITKKITKVTFTCEGPEYWDFLAQTNRDLLLSLYRQYASSEVQLKDLINNNQYIERNKWNNSTTGGIMHLIQKNNTLGAEIELAGGSSVVRKIRGRILTGQQELIRCGQYGVENRNSDPFIGSQVNTFTRQNAFVTLKDPVGLYFDDFEPFGWETPDGSDPQSFWKILRGELETPVRAIYEVPKEQGFTVTDITINGIPIKYGAQIADFVKIKLMAVAQNFGKNTTLPLTDCRRPKIQLLSTRNASHMNATLSTHGVFGKKLHDTSSLRTTPPVNHRSML